MKSAKIYFADSTSIVVNEGDIITPIICHSDTDGKFASMSTPMEIYNHVQNGLIPALMDVFCFSTFFYVGNDYDVVYGTNSIVKIENI